MRIAEIAPPWTEVPPPSYGGVELIVSQLADGLAARGHDVTLFASGGSRTLGDLVSPLPEPPPLEDLGDVWDDAYHSLRSHLAADGAEVVHDHSTAVGSALAALAGQDAAVVHTVHGELHDRARRHYRLIHESVHLVAISEAQRRQAPELRWAGVVHNAVDAQAHPEGTSKEDFVLFVGRTSPDKGPEIAVDVARRAGLPLVMVVKRAAPDERDHWDRHVAPLLNGDVEVLEDVSQEKKTDLFGRARATLFPIRWEEPFGLVMIESMACGTPVLAFPRGAAPEVICDGVSGFLCRDADEMVRSLGRVDELAPERCRAWVKERFSTDSMVAGYERLFRSLVR
ncbi:MAG TPA: glycosyltransferase family 4 protein [Actinomycetota bacterium]|nr:glycosyltransferase family 4 protein [Actinomycetota bacterium]